MSKKILIYFSDKEEKLLKKINKAAENAYMSRSGYMKLAAEEKIEKKEAK